jgi:hypothetical protein
MTNLTYKQILSGYTIHEEGDFFQYYKLHNGGYILYSPRKEKISCIELFNFTEISPEDLGILLDKPIFMRSDIEEFSFEIVTQKEVLLQYIFDVGFLDKKTGYFTHSIQPGEGYLVNCISPNKKSKGINFIHTQENRVGVRFDNLIAYRDNDNTESSNLYITFDPDKYNSIINDAGINNDFFVVLLASANNLLFNKVYEYEKSTSVIIGKEDPLLILQLYAFYLNKSEYDFISVDSDYSQILVGFNKDMLGVPDVLSLMNKCIEDIRSEFGNDINTFYDIKASGRYTFISFRKSRPLIVSFNNRLREAFKEKLTLNTVL